MAQLNELRKALTSSDVSALIPEDLEPALVEYLYTVSPLISLIDKKQASGKTHEVNVRTDVPDAWFEGELTTPVSTNSTYTRQSVQMKIVRIAGEVSHFAQATTSEYTNLLATELEASVEATARLIEFQDIWGNATADAYQFNGLDAMISADATDNIFDVDGTITLSTLDNMIDAVEESAGVDRDPKLFVMSNKMISKIAGLETRVGMDVTSLEYPGGLRMTSYRGIPMLAAGYVRPKGTAFALTSATQSTASGTLGVGAYRYKVAPVTLTGGEKVSGAMQTATLAGVGKITLAWTADADARLYKIYRTAAGEADDDDNYDLIATVAAKTYDGSGNVTGNVVSFIDDGSYTANTYVHPLGSNEETIWLVDLNPSRGFSQLVLPNRMGADISAGQGMIKYVPLAKVKSSESFMLESFVAAQLPWAKTCAVARRVSIT